MPDGVSALAASAGRVTFAAMTPVGNTIIVQHQNGWTTYYTHVSTLAVHKGQAVAAGIPPRSSPHRHRERRERSRASTTRACAPIAAAERFARARHALRCRAPRTSPMPGRRHRRGSRSHGRHLPRPQSTAVRVAPPKTDSPRAQPFARVATRRDQHSFGTHAATFGVNPWKLMQWMGHPEPILQAQRGHDDPDQKVIAMLDARRLCETVGRGKGVANPKALTDENLSILVR